MNFRLWLIYKRVTRKISTVYNSRFLCWFRNSLLFNVIRMTILVLGIVYILFLFSPSEGNIYFSDKVDSLELEASSISGTLETDHVNLQIEDNCKITLNNFCIDYNNKRYEDIEYLLLTVKKDSPFGSIGIRRNDNIITSAFFSNTQLIGQDNSVRCFNKDIILNTGILLGGLESAEYKVWVTGATVSAYNSNDKKIFDTTEFIFIVDENLYGTPYLTTTVKTTLITPNILMKYNELPIINYCSANFENVSDITFVGSGDIVFSLSASPTTYTIHDQTVDFHGVSNELSTSMKITEDPLENDISLTVSGKVNEANISDMTLFPTFTGWYTNNIYLAPLSLVSIIFGSISLLKKKRE